MKGMVGKLPYCLPTFSMYLSLKVYTYKPLVTYNVLDNIPLHHHYYLLYLY